MNAVRVLRRSSAALNRLAAVQAGILRPSAKTHDQPRAVTAPHPGARPPPSYVGPIVALLQELCPSAELLFPLELVRRTEADHEDLLDEVKLHGGISRQQSDSRLHWKKQRSDPRVLWDLVHELGQRDHASFPDATELLWGPHAVVLIRGLEPADLRSRLAPRLRQTLQRSHGEVGQHGPTHAAASVSDLRREPIYVRRKTATQKSTRECTLLGNHLAEVELPVGRANTPTKYCLLFAQQGAASISNWSDGGDGCVGATGAVEDARLEAAQAACGFSVHLLLKTCPAPVRAAVISMWKEHEQCVAPSSMVRGTHRSKTFWLSAVGHLLSSQIASVNTRDEIQERVHRMASHYIDQCSCGDHPREQRLDLISSLLRSSIQWASNAEVQAHSLRSLEDAFSSADSAHDEGDHPQLLPEDASHRWLTRALTITTRAMVFQSYAQLTANTRKEWPFRHNYFLPNENFDLLVDGRREVETAMTTR